MPYDPDRHHRRSIRLKAYDYRKAGAYFVSICVQDRACLFGEIADSQMMRSDAGRMLHQAWIDLPTRYPGIDIDLFIVMPNHIHGIIVLPDGRTAGDADGGRHRGTAPTNQGHTASDGGPVHRLSLPDVIQRYKSFTTAQYRRGVIESGWAPLRGRLWQRNYYEHIIRNERALDTIRRYIDANPARWTDDEDNPANPNRR